MQPAGIFMLKLKLEQEKWINAVQSIRQTGYVRIVVLVIQIEMQCW